MKKCGTDRKASVSRLILLSRASYAPKWSELVRIPSYGLCGRSDRALFDCVAKDVLRMLGAFHHGKVVFILKATTCEESKVDNG